MGEDVFDWHETGLAADGSLLARQVPRNTRISRLEPACQLEARLFKLSKHCTRALYAPLVLLEEASSCDFGVFPEWLPLSPLTIFFAHATSIRRIHVLHVAVVEFRKRLVRDMKPFSNS